MRKPRLVTHEPWSLTESRIGGVVLGVSLSFFLVVAFQAVMFGSSPSMIVCLLAAVAGLSASIGLLLNECFSMPGLRTRFCQGLVLVPLALAAFIVRDAASLVLWLVVLSGPVLVMSLSWRVCRAIWGAPVYQDGTLCSHCAYSLVGNQSGVCPECGHALAESSA